VADLAGGDWPTRARAAALELNAARADADPSLGIALLRDLRTLFAIRDDVGEVTGWHDQLATERLLELLHALEESPWGDLRGKPLDARGLARRLRPYEVRPTTIRVGDATPKGYRREDLVDAWSRYLPGTPEIGATSATPQASTVAPVANVADSQETASGALFEFDDPGRWAR
jgi:Protein of unknown function (DUF3631)